jgi:hypothetical protein
MTAAGGWWDADGRTEVVAVILTALLLAVAGGVYHHRASETARSDLHDTYRAGQPAAADQVGPDTRSPGPHAPSVLAEAHGLVVVATSRQGRCAVRWSTEPGGPVESATVDADACSAARAADMLGIAP